MQGVEPSEYSNKRVEEPEPRVRDVIFTGGFAAPFQDRHVAIQALRGHFSVGVFGRNSNRRIYNDDFWREHQRSRIAFIPTPPREAPKQYWSNRIYLATATGTPCVVGWTEGLDEQFEDERDVLYFRTQAEMISQVSRLKADPELRRRIGLAGRERTLREHTYQARSRQLIDAITTSK
ncbi:MAG: glycosyltransferase [Dehalococcoidia bacterium]